MAWWRMVVSMAAVTVLAASAAGTLFAAGAAGGAEVPRMDSVGLLDPQPFASDPAVIWYDNFDSEANQSTYFEGDGPLVDKEHIGLAGKSLECFYAKGDQGKGGRKLAFGDSPIGQPVKPGQQFTELYWRMYVKHQKGWTGGAPAKMSRATIINADNWSQAMISHVWGGGRGGSLSLDPVRGAAGTECITTKYNDFDNLVAKGKWLQNSPASQFKISATEESGRWVAVEAQAKLNTPGQSDGYNCLWIDGIKQCERTSLDFRASYTAKGINCLFLEAYWNSGSPVDQYRWYDDLVVSTKPIGPVYTSASPALIKTPYSGEGTQKAWEVEVAAVVEVPVFGGQRAILAGSIVINRSEKSSAAKDPVIGEDVDGEVVWKSKTIEGDGLQVKLDAANGAFVGPLAGKDALAPGQVYFCRVRQQASNGQWSDWSNWHQAFQTAAK